MTAMPAIHDIPATAPIVAQEMLHLLDSFPEPKILLDGQFRIFAANAAYR